MFWPRDLGREVVAKGRESGRVRPFGGWRGSGTNKRLIIEWREGDALNFFRVVTVWALKCFE